MKRNIYIDSQVAVAIKNPPAGAGDIRDLGSVPGSGRSPGGGHGLGNSPGKRSLVVTDCGVTKSQT